jgi:hypothetical protein
MVQGKNVMAKKAKKSKKAAKKRISKKATRKTAKKARKKTSSWVLGNARDSQGTALVRKKARGPGPRPPK